MTPEAETPPLTPMEARRWLVAAGLPCDGLSLGELVTVGERLGAGGDRLLGVERLLALLLPDDH